MKTQRITTYQVKYNEITENGTIEVRTKWENRIEDLNPKFLYKDGAVIIERSYDQYFPTMQEVREGAKTGNKFWLNTNEVKKELAIDFV